MDGIVESVRSPERYTCSPAESALWFLDLKQKVSLEYNIVDGAVFLGRCNREAFSDSVAFIIARQFSFRSGFVDDGGLPYKVIEPAVSPRIAFVRLTTALNDSESGIEAQWRALAEYSFNLAEPPLLRFIVLDFVDDRHIIIWVFHHIVGDGTSEGLFRRELLRAYRSARRGDKFTSFDLPTAREFHATASPQSADEERNRSYWNSLLKDAPAPLRLGNAKHIQRNGARLSRQVVVLLGQEMTLRLKSFARQQSVTLYILLAGIFAALLAKHSGSNDVLIGTPISRRGQHMVSNLIAHLVDTSLLRVRCPLHATLVSVLADVKDQTAHAIARGPVFFDDVNAESGIAAAANTVRAWFAHQNTYRAADEDTVAEARYLERAPQFVRFDVELHTSVIPTGLELSFLFDTELFDRSSSHRFSEHFINLLQKLTAAPTQPLSTVGHLSLEERSSILAFSSGETRPHR